MRVKAGMTPGNAGCPREHLLAVTEDIPEGTQCLEVIVKAHRESCAMLEDIPSMCDCKPSVGATSVRVS